MNYRTKRLIICLLTLASITYSCKKKPAKSEKPATIVIKKDKTPPTSAKILRTFLVKEDVSVRNYFEFIDKVIINESWRLHAPLSEHIIVWANPWIIDSLENTDYYRLKEKGIFSEDQQAIVILKKGTKLIIPDSMMVDSISKRLSETLIDVNIPEFKIRVVENGKVLYTFPIRVGKDKSKYLAMAGRTMGLQTRTGKGQILQVNKNAVYMNPVDNKVYYKTHRDDGKYTKLPRLPWIIPEINGQVYGQLIHPTTNPTTLGKPASNGCIGMGEADLWRLYYHAPIGTQIVIRYDLQVIDEKGDTLHLPDIYAHN